MFEAWPSLASALIALAAAGASGYFSYRSLKHTRRSLDHTRFSTQVQYFADLRSWADEASATLSKCVHLCDVDPVRCEEREFFERRLELRAEVSSLIDRGRWYFPNVHHEQVGVHKEPAFRGLRQSTLDALVAAYGLLGRLSCHDHEPNLGMRRQFVSQSRTFVSEIQEVLDPRTQAEEFKRLVGDPPMEAEATTHNHALAPGGWRRR